MKIYNVPTQVQQVAGQAPGLGKNPVAAAGAPLALSSELGAVAAGSTAVFPTQNLQPRIRGAYWIDEIVIVVGLTSTASGGQLTGSLAANLNFLFSTGAYNLTKFPIPAMMFSKIFGMRELQRGPAIAAPGYALYNTFRWVLPKPLYMPAGDVLQCSVARNSGAAGGSGIAMRNAVITYKGRACAPGDEPPPYRCIPWVSYFKFDNADTYDETADEFRNPFLAPLFVQRFIGRIVTFGAETPSTSPFGGALLEPDGPVDGAITISLPTEHMLLNAAAISSVSIKMLDSMGYAIVPNMTPMGMVIEPEHSAWTFNRQLSAREQVTVAFQRNVGTVPNAFDTYLSMVGYRQEKV